MPEDLDKILHSDTLGELAKKERRNLLAASLIAVAMSAADIAHLEITYWGIKVPAFKPSALLWLIAAVVTYFLVSYFVYAVPDFLAWWTRYKKWQYDTEREWLDYIDEYGEPDEDMVFKGDPPASFRQYADSRKVLQKSIFVKAFALNLFLPYIVGWAALFFVFSTAPFLHLLLGVP